MRSGCDGVTKARAREDGVLDGAGSCFERLVQSDPNWGNFLYDGATGKIGALPTPPARCAPQAGPLCAGGLRPLPAQEHSPGCVLHALPHASRPAGLIDFGATRPLSEAFVAEYVELVWAAAERGATLVALYSLHSLRTVPDAPSSDGRGYSAGVWAAQPGP
eukprot:SAG11_NODE_3827_length_2200_cov_2.709186_1_plen_162_part_00